MPQFYAFTSQNPQASGWVVVGEGTDRSATREAAERTICGPYWDQPKPIDVDTELKNLTVMSASAAARRAAFRSAIERHLDSSDDN